MILRGQLKLLMVCISLAMCGVAHSQCAQFFVTAPGVFTGNTCGASNSCGNYQIDHVFEVVIPFAGNWTFSTCGSSYDTWLTLSSGTCCGTFIESNDDFCDYQSEITANIIAGTYTVLIDGAFTLPSCGEYTLTISELSLGLSIASNDVNCNGPCPLKLYPNPSKGEFIVELEKPFDSSLEFNLFDLSGRLVEFVGNIPAGATTLNVDIRTLTNGIYYLQVAGQEGTMSRKIIIE